VEKKKREKRRLRAGGSSDRQYYILREGIKFPGWKIPIQFSFTLVVTVRWRQSVGKWNFFRL
jgi:hypothetical protein